MKLGHRLFLPLLFAWLCALSAAGAADSTFVVSVSCRDTRSPLSHAVVKLFFKDRAITCFTDERGETTYHGDHTLLDSLKVTMVGYRAVTRVCHGEYRVRIALPSETQILPEVYVTARETNTLQTTSVITRELSLIHI